MNKIEKQTYNRVNEVIYKKVLSNGLTVFINKKVGYNKTFLSFISNFGASDTKFIPINETDYFEAPLGVAHFLEHKMFEMPNGTDASNLFASLGADSNAYTDYNETAYIVSCTSNFEKVLEILLDFVQTPYFTDENVSKEKGIIIEEFKMYQDNPTDRLYSCLMKNMYKKNNLREDVVGNIESINSISKEILYKCYNTFYHPSNMCLCISGDVDVDRTFELIEINQGKKTFDKFDGVKCKYNIEDNIVYRKSGSSTMDIVMPRVGIGIKLPTFEYDADEIIKVECITKILLEYYFGFSSDNYQYMLDQELISGFTYSFHYDLISSHVKFVANSFNPKRLVNFMKKELLNLSSKDIDVEFFENIKKGLIGIFIRSYDSEENVATSYVEYHFRNANIFHAIEVIESLTIEEVKEFIKYINENSITYYIIKPKEIKQ